MDQTLDLKNSTDEYDVSTVMLSPYALLMQMLAGESFKGEYETAVFRAGTLNLSTEEFMEGGDDSLPVHIESYETESEARDGHARVMQELRAGTLEFKPPTL